MSDFAFGGELKPPGADQLLKASPAYVAFGRGIDAEDSAGAITAQYEAAGVEVLCKPVDEQNLGSLHPFRILVLVLPSELHNKVSLELGDFARLLRVYRRTWPFGLDAARSGLRKPYEVGVVHLVGPSALLLHPWVRQELHEVCRVHPCGPGLTVDLTASQILEGDPQPDADAAGSRYGGVQVAAARARVATYWRGARQPDITALRDYLEDRREYYNRPRGNRKHPRARLHRPLGEADPRNAFDLLLDGLLPRDEANSWSPYFKDDLQAAGRETIADMQARFPGYKPPYRFGSHFQQLYLDVRIIQQNEMHFD